MPAFSLCRAAAQKYFMTKSEVLFAKTKQHPKNGWVFMKRHTSWICIRTVQCFTGTLKIMDIVLIT